MMRSSQPASQSISQCSSGCGDDEGDDEERMAVGGKIVKMREQKSEKERTSTVK